MEVRVQGKWHRKGEDWHVERVSENVMCVEENEKAPSDLPARNIMCAKATSFKKNENCDVRIVVW